MQRGPPEIHAILSLMRMRVGYVFSGSSFDYSQKKKVYREKCFFAIHVKQKEKNDMESLLKSISDLSNG